MRRWRRDGGGRQEGKQRWDSVKSRHVSVSRHFCCLSHQDAAWKRKLLLCWVLLSLSLSLVTTLCSCEVVVSIVDRDDLTSRETHLVFSRHKNIMKFERILFFTQQRRSEIISSGVFDKIDWCDLSSVQLLEQLLFHLHHFAHGFTRCCANLKDHLHRIWNEKAGR